MGDKNAPQREERFYVDTEQAGARTRVYKQILKVCGFAGFIDF